MSTHKWLKMLRRPSPLLLWLLLMAGWEASYRTIGWKAWLFPAPSHVLDATLGLLGAETYFGEPIASGWPMKASKSLGTDETKSAMSAPLPHALVTSGARLLAGFGFSLLLGSALGLAMWRFHFVDRLLGPVFWGFKHCRACAGCRWRC
ncbi:MAG: hypothetical protein IPK83_08450 [Planctomycetes bacterium]|nr:hypothetical protein [Planctomycetota bacterium]